MPPKINFKEITKEKQPKKKDQKTKTSIFYFTVNSNKSTASLNDEEIENWKNQQRDLWANKTYYLLTMNPELKHLGEGEYSLVPDLLIKNINVEIAFEIGSTVDRLHLHGIIKVEHFTKLRLNYTLIHQILHELMGDDNQYFKSIVRHDDKESFLDYMSKYDAKIEKYSVK